LAASPGTAICQGNPAAVQSDRALSAKVLVGTIVRTRGGRTGRRAL